MFDVIFDNIEFLLKGLRITLALGLLSIFFSLILGTFLGVLRYSKIPFISQLCTVFIEITRSVPLVIYIVFMHFTLSPFLYSADGFLTHIFGSSALEFQTATIALSLFTSAYIAEIVRSGLKSVEASLVLASKSLGLTYVQRLRYVVLPISFKRMAPALISQFISLTKDTSLASVIALIEFTRAGEIIYERTHQELEVLLFLAIIYFVICYSLSLFGKRIESSRKVFGI